MSKQLSRSPIVITLGLFAALLVATSGCSSTQEKTRSDKTLPVKNGSTQKIHNQVKRRHKLVVQAKSLLDTNYKRGGNSPRSGMDCSGFVHYVYKQAWGANLPRTTSALSKSGMYVPARELEEGDLVFYNTRHRKFSHVGIYIGNSQFIHSPSSGGQVRIENMSMVYWKKRYNGARRLKDPGNSTLSGHA
jgi:cell wall-associated NlpC family hydrolase